MVTVQNIFRFLGYFFQVSSKAVLLHKIQSTSSVSGLSLNTQILYLLVYIFRYLDIIVGHSDWKSKLYIYNTIMKVGYIASQCVIVYYIFKKYRHTYQSRFETFNMSFILVPSMALSLFLVFGTTTILEWIEEYLYSASLIIESVAILPQLVMVQDAGDSETLTSHYIFLLGLYRLAYFISFILKCFLVKPRPNALIVATSLIQSLLYLDFFTVYYRYVMSKSSFTRML